MSSNTTTIKNLIRPRDDQGIQVRTLRTQITRTHTHTRTFSGEGTEPGVTATRSRLTPPSPARAPNSRLSDPPRSFAGGRPSPHSAAGDGRRRCDATGRRRHRPHGCWPNRQEGPVFSSRTRATTTPGPPATTSRAEHQSPRPTSLRRRATSHSPSWCRRSTVEESCRRGGVGRGIRMHECAVGAPSIGPWTQTSCTRGALLSGRTHLDVGEALTPLGCPIPAVAWNLQTFDEPQTVATRRENVACTTECGGRRRVQYGV